MLAETLLATGPAPAPGGERHQVNIHTDLDVLLDQDPTVDEQPDRAARIEDGPELHPETLRRICCDSAAGIIAHHRDRRPGTSMDVGRRTRVIPAALRRALFLRDHGCRFPGCSQRRFVDAHHARHWSRRGPTALWNLVLLCRHHHRLVHEGGFRLDGDGHGGFSFHRPDGTVLPESPRPPGGRPDAVPDLHAATITASTAWPAWYGEPLRLDYAVDVLLRAAGSASAEASTPPKPADPSLN